MVEITRKVISFTLWVHTFKRQFGMHSLTINDSWASTNRPCIGQADESARPIDCGKDILVYRPNAPLESCKNGHPGVRSVTYWSLSHYLDDCPLLFMVSWK